MPIAAAQRSRCDSCGTACNPSASVAVSAATPASHHPTSTTGRGSAESGLIATSENGG